MITSPVNIRYFTGFATDTGYLLLTPRAAYFLTDKRYDEAARGAITSAEVVGFSSLADSLLEILGGEAIQHLLIETDVVTLAQFERLKELLSPVTIVGDAALCKEIKRMRESKSAAEIEAIRHAQEITELSFSHILGEIREGVSERELSLELEFFMRRNGAEKVAFDLIVASGENGSMPHAVPSERRIKSGDFITFDIGAVYGGYHSDMTRTVAFGSITSEQRAVYETVREAQARAMEYLFAGGRTASLCDKAAREYIEQHGYGKNFTHSTGHGVGLEIHENPTVSYLSKGEIVSGSVITVEPGIYIEGQFGVRTENMLYVSDSEVFSFTSIGSELIIL
jgi:Xaa-Pro aminopeptidase